MASSYRAAQSAAGDCRSVTVKFPSLAFREAGHISQIECAGELLRQRKLKTGIAAAHCKPMRTESGFAGAKNSSGPCQPLAQQPFHPWGEPSAVVGVAYLAHCFGLRGIRMNCAGDGREPHVGGNGKCQF